MRRSSRPLRGVCRAERHPFCPSVVGAHPDATCTGYRAARGIVAALHATSPRPGREAPAVQSDGFNAPNIGCPHAAFFIALHAMPESAVCRLEYSQRGPWSVVRGLAVVWPWHARPMPPMQAAMRACTRPCGGAVRHVRGVRCGALGDLRWWVGAPGAGAWGRWPLPGLEQKRATRSGRPVRWRMRLSVPPRRRLHRPRRGPWAAA